MIAAYSIRARVRLRDHVICRTGRDDHAVRPSGVTSQGDFDAVADRAHISVFAHAIDSAAVKCDGTCSLIDRFDHPRSFVVSTMAWYSAIFSPMVSTPACKAAGLFTKVGGQRT
jgi:hypothetical protein